MSNTNDAIMPALLVWGFWLASSPTARGVTTALAGWTKFAALALAPLWLTYRATGKPARMGRFALGFALATLAAFSILLLEPSLRDAIETFWDRTRRLPARPRRHRSRSGAGGRTTRAASPTSRRSRPSSRSATIALAGDRGARPARQGAARARGALGRGPPRGRALPHALVLPLPSLGAPVRPARAVPARENVAQRPPGGRGAGGGHCVTGGVQTATGRWAPSPEALARVRGLRRNRRRGHRRVGGPRRRGHGHRPLPRVRRAHRRRRRAVPRLRLRVPPGRTSRDRAAGARHRLAPRVPDRVCRGDGARRRGRRPGRRRRPSAARPSAAGARPVARRGGAHALAARRRDPDSLRPRAGRAGRRGGRARGRRPSASGRARRRCRRPR